MVSKMGNIIEPGFYPFWFWNDYINKEEIGYQVREMSSQGVKGFYIHPRQGLQQPYLSESFFEMVDETLKIAEEENLSVSLYDEYPYPSGNAGGAVTMGKPHFYATMLIHRSYEVVGGQIRLQLPQGKILSAKGYPICDGKVVFEEEIDLTDNIGIVLTEDSYLETGLTKYNRKRYFASNPTPVLEAYLPDNTYKIYLSIQAEVKNHKYWDNYVDILNPDAVKEFIKLTYEKYKERYINKFGKSIPMIFVDEIAAMWSQSIPEAFIKEYDYDLIDHMTALQDSSHPEHIKVSYDLYRLKYSMFCNSFEKPISQWCKENGIKYCGEKPAMRLAQLKYIDIPGCDPGHTKAGAKLDILQSSLRGNAKATASAAYFYDKEGALCECYHSIGWSGTLQDAKIIAEGLLLFGIKYLVPHGFFYSTHGLKKHDAPPSFFFQMPYWPLFGVLSNRIEKIYKQFENSFIDAALVVVDLHSGLPSEENLASYENILTMLVDNHIDFHIVDTDILEKGTIEENGSVSIKEIKANSGVIEYTTNFSLDIVPNQEYVFLEMGYEQEFYEASEVSVNNSKFEPVLWQPRCIKIKTEYLKKGTNQLKTRVYSLPELKSSPIISFIYLLTEI